MIHKEYEILILEKFSSYLKEQRKINKISQKKLSEITGVSQPRISLIERNKVICNIVEMRALLIGVEADFVLMTHQEEYAWKMLKDPIKEEDDIYASMTPIQKRTWDEMSAI